MGSEGASVRVRQPGWEETNERPASSTAVHPLASSKSEEEESINRGFYQFSRWPLLVCWLLVVMIHAFCAAFYVLIAMMYYNLVSTNLIWTIILYSLSIEVTAYKAVTVVHAGLAAAHVFAIIKILYLSLRQCRLTLESPVTAENLDKTEGRVASLKRLRSKVDSLLQLVELALDFLSVIVIPCVLLNTYYEQYDSRRQDFSRAFYYDDQSLLQLLNEFKLLLVYSVPDLLQRLLLGSDLLLCARTIKSLVRPTTHPSAICPTSHFPSATSTPQKTVMTTIAVVPIHPKANSGVDDDDKSTSTKARASVQMAKTNTKMFHAVCILWGFLVAGAQLYAEIKPVSADCIIVVRPWFRPKPGCALIELSGAHVSADQETQDAIAKRLAAFDEDAVSYLILSHHEALYVPNNLQNLHNLVGLKMNNFTLIEWGEDAALTQTNHPRARFVFLLLLDVEICVSTLSDVPSNLSAVWPPGAWLFVDHSNFTKIPDVLVDMKLTYLSLSFNEISTVPVGLFTNHWLTLIGLSGNPVSQLPEVPAQNRTALDLLSLDSTNLSVLPSWMDDSFFASTVVYLGDTPQCDATVQNNLLSHPRLCRVQDDCRKLVQLL
ncbi:TPA: hypothetical protein N0F65_001122 [Lagenidium giganteum]|uniref:Leucine-rich repeat domain, L domain-like n=1 Tax=Lagenidium giganteum TaxID=4803 RepID=A0AAV2YJ42_9STRA|nr:TPA: hypothetical protein N0F65_001122 [Lagenidium giganteum]